MEIPLKLKYRAFNESTRFGHSPASDNHNPKKIRHAHTDRERALHAAQPKKVMHILANGKRRMEVTE